MINFCNKKYASNDSEAIDSLFTPSTVNGFYQIEASGVVLFDLQGKERAFIRRDGLGPVSLHAHNKKRIYSFAASTIEKEWLGMPKSYTESNERAKELVKSIY